MTIKQLKEKYLKTLALQGYADGTILYRNIYLDQFLCFLQQQKVETVEQITKALVHDYQRQLGKQPLATLTLHSKLSTLSCFLSWLFDNHYLFFDLASAIRFPKRVVNAPRHILSEPDMLRLLALPDTTTPKGIRDKAMLELLYSTAIRRSELLGLTVYDINRDDQTVKVTGKGGKQRVVPVGSQALFWLTYYVDQVRSTLRIDHAYLFINLHTRRSLKGHALNCILRQYVNESGLTQPITPHSFRHTCATHLLRRGADIRYIQELLGHASPETTQIYTRVDISDLHNVFRKTHPRACKK